MFLTDDPTFFMDRVRGYMETNKASLPARVSQLTTQLTHLCVMDEVVNTHMVFKALVDAGLLEVYGGRVHRNPSNKVDISRYFPGAPPIILQIAEKAVAWVNSSGMLLRVFKHPQMLSSSLFHTSRTL